METGTEKTVRKGVRARGSGIAPGEKMKGTSDIRSVTIMANLQFQIDKFFNAIYVQRQGRSIWQMVYDRIDTGKIKRSNKQFHMVNPVIR